MANDHQPSVELVMEEMKPLRTSDNAAADVEIRDGQTSKTEQSCGTCLLTALLAGIVFANNT